MSEVTREAADLTTVMRIVLHQVHEHVHDAARHALHTRPSGGDGGFEQTRQVLSGLPQGTLGLQWGRAIAIE
jgi:hypothetical protein